MYSGLSFFQCLSLFFTRLFTGGLLSPVSDEIQILALVGMGVASSFVGTFLILRSMTMMANALSHTLLVGIVLGYLILLSAGGALSLSVPHLFISAILAALVTVLLTEFLKKGLFLQEDASIGLVFTSLFAGGIILVSLFTKNQHVGLELVMGNVDALTKKEVGPIFLVLGVTLFLFILFFKEFKATTFDARFAKSLGMKPGFFHVLLMIVTALVGVSAFQAVGVLLVLAFFTLSPLIARLYVHTLKKLIGVSCLIVCAASVGGVALSRHLLTVFDIGLSTGGIVVTLLAFGYGISLGLKPLLERYVLPQAQ